MKNRLKQEKSPYLLLHADNPVDWYPWGEEAKQKAVREDKPMLISIGYSSCHWCHVIARESFQNREVAEELNRAFVSVKVDKEERPDVDAVYMAACQAVTGSGGWPMTILALPDGRPFYTATYLPKPTLLQLLAGVENLWQADRGKVEKAAEQIAAALQSGLGHGVPLLKEQELTETAYRQFAASFDEKWGGFGPAPKFPSPHNLLFLMHYARRTREPKALQMAEMTLTRMYRGGIFDHVGGGFCRYSTDRTWLIPHFEKMLYDNALLLWAYAEAYADTGRPLYRRVGEATADYVLREMTGPGGEFFGSQDADSQGSEGAYYTVTPGELDEVLGKEEAARFCRWFGITPEGNFEGKSIPNLLENEEYADDMPEMDALREGVYAWRRGRMSLSRDDKVLTAWNAMMVTALSKAAKAFGRPDYRAAADRAADFIGQNLQKADGRLFIRWRDGESKGDGIADDYAFFALALLELGRLREAEKLTQILLDHSFDWQAGGLFLYADDGERLFLRPKETFDGAVPTGNSVFLHVLSWLAREEGKERWKQALKKQRNFLTGEASRYPAGFAFALTAMTRER